LARGSAGIEGAGIERAGEDDEAGEESCDVHAVIL
jgi:hypothetical protein